jgi:hypothetical protein
MIAWSIMPLGYLLAGPLADQVFRPLLLEGGQLADSVGRIVGVGPGRGTGLMFVILGLMEVLVAGSGYLNPRVRRVEAELPDARKEGDAPAAGQATGEQAGPLSAGEAHSPATGD